MIGEDLTHTPSYASLMDAISQHRECFLAVVLKGSTEGMATLLFQRRSDSLDLYVNFKRQ